MCHDTFHQNYNNFRRIPLFSRIGIFLVRAKLSAKEIFDFSVSCYTLYLIVYFEVNNGKLTFC